MPSDAVTSVRLPANGPASDGKKIVKLMRDDLGVTIVGGQDELDGKILRLSHFGYCGDFDVITVIAGLELALARLGHPLELGRGVSAVMKELSK
jgi:aspartate aminotransferase-like enzyme